MTHPAPKMTFDELWAGLKAAKAADDLNENVGSDGLSLFCYSKSCVYERHWNEITMTARGIILDPAEKRVVALPFPKFFNVGDRADSIPGLPFEVLEKFDGSLIILFHHKGQWRCATRVASPSTRPSGRPAGSRASTCWRRNRARPTLRKPYIQRIGSSSTIRRPG